MATENKSPDHCMDVGRLIKLIHSHPCLWDESHESYHDRQKREDTWQAIAEELHQDWEQYSSQSRNQIVDDVKKRWKSVWEHCTKVKKLGSTSESFPDKQAKFTYYEAMQFILQSKGQQASSGNYTEALPESPADANELQPWEREPTPSTSTQADCEVEGDTGLAVVAQLSSSEEEEGIITSPAAPLPPAAADPFPPEATLSSHDVPPSCTPSTWEHTRRTPRVTDRLLEVESQAMSLTQRLSSDDRIDSFGQMLGASCRQLQADRQDPFMSFTLAALEAIKSAPTLPEMGELITQFLTAMGLYEGPPRPQESPQVESIATQTDSISFHPPPGS